MPDARRPPKHLPLRTEGRRRRTLSAIRGRTARSPCASPPTLDVWLDQHEIQPAERWDRAIEAALKAADTVLVLLSPRSAASENVGDEVAFALDSGKTVIPVLIEPTQAPLRMARLQFIDATGDYPAALARCIAALSSSEPQQPSAPATPVAVIPPDAMQRIAVALTAHLGPIARLKVEREARQASSPAALIERLAAEIDDERARTAFRKAAGS